MKITGVWAYYPVRKYLGIRLFTTYILAAKYVYIVHYYSSSNIIIFVQIVRNSAGWLFKGIHTIF